MTKESFNWPVNNKATIGTTSVSVSRLGFGGAPIGGLYSPVDEEQAQQTIDASWDAGIRYFDTAPHYGAGTSELRLGRALSTRPRHDFVVSTKIGRLLREGPHDEEGYMGEPKLSRIFDYSEKGVYASLSESIERLRLDYIDMIYVHDPDDHYREACDQALPLLMKLRQEGIVRAIGVGMNQAEMLTRFVRNFDLDCVLLAGRYTLLDQTGMDELMPLCLERSTSVVIGGVFNSGLLADPTKDPRYNYGTPSVEILSRARQLDMICRHHNTPLAKAALWFPLGHPAVANVLVGMRTPDEVRQAAEFLNDTPPPADLWKELRSKGLIHPEVPFPESISSQSMSRDANVPRNES